METARAFSIWLAPRGEAYCILSDIISNLSKNLHSPNFPPHVTLLGSLLGSEKSLKQKCAQLASRLKPYRISLGKLEYTDEYSRSLFIRVEESEDVLRANLIAREIFDRKTDPDYFPHLSLIYGIFPSPTKQALIEELGREHVLSFEVESLQLVDTSDSRKPENWFPVMEFSCKQ